MPKKFIKIGCTLLVIFVACVFLKEFYSYSQMNAYQSLLNGEIEGIKFSGQMKVIETSDPDVIKDFQDAFKNGRYTSESGGVSYKVTFELKNHKSLTTDIDLYEDKTGFMVADYSHLGAGDPAYIGIQFKAGMNKKTATLLNLLLL